MLPEENRRECREGDLDRGGGLKGDTLRGREEVRTLLLLLISRLAIVSTGWNTNNSATPAHLIRRALKHLGLGWLTGRTRSQDAGCARVFALPSDERRRHGWLGCDAETGGRGKK